MERQALICPVCGAPHRKTVPSGVAQVRCRYCGAAIIVPTNAPRCPNHPDLLATAVCNDCGGNFCRDCLTPFEIGEQSERGTLQLCPNCLSRRRSDRAERTVLGGILALVFGVLLMLAQPVVGVLFVVLAAGLIAYGAYSGHSSQAADGFPSASTSVERQRPFQDPQLLYQDALAEFVKSFGVVRGSLMLENRIKAYMNDGLSREEAVRKLAEETAY